MADTFFLSFFHATDRLAPPLPHLFHHTTDTDGQMGASLCFLCFPGFTTMHDATMWKRAFGFHKHELFYA